MFSRDCRDHVASGERREITVSIRLWSRPRVKVGGRYPSARVVIEIDSTDDKGVTESAWPIQVRAAVHAQGTEDRQTSEEWRLARRKSMADSVFRPT